MALTVRKMQPFRSWEAAVRRMIKMSDWIKIKLFPQRNRTLMSLTLVLVLSILLIVKYCNAPLLLPEIYFSFLLCTPEGDKTLYNIAISYLAAYVFYLIQVFFPSRQKENRAYRLIRRQLSELIRDTKELIYIFHEMYDVGDYGELSLRRDKVLFYKESWDSYKLSHDIAKPNPERIKEGKYKHSGYFSCKGEDAFCERTEKVRNKYERLMESRYLQNCDESLIDMLEGFTIGILCSTMKGAVLMRKNADRINDLVYEIYTVPCAADELNGIFKGTPELAAIPQKDYVEISCNGDVIGNLGIPRQKDVNRISEIAYDLQTVEQQISRFEFFCDVDGTISFRKCTDEEKRRNKYGEEFGKRIQREWKAGQYQK